MFWLGLTFTEARSGLALSWDSRLKRPWGPAWPQPALVRLSASWGGEGLIDVGEEDEGGHLDGGEEGEGGHLDGGEEGK